MAKFESPTVSSGQKSTENRWGTIKVATSVEAANALKDDVAITPKKLQYAPAATTTRPGVLETATDAETQARAATDKIVTPSNLAADGFMQWRDTTLTAAQVKALAATPITIVPAPAAGKSILFHNALLKLNYGGTNAFTEADDNLAIRYTDGSGAIVSETIEMTGFIDQTADTYTTAVPKADAIVAATGIEAQALVLDNLNDEIAGNAADDNTVTVRVYYTVQTL